MVLCEEVCIVGAAVFPTDGELVGHSVLGPEVSHVDWPRSSLFDGYVCECSGSGVIGVDWRWWLRKSHVVERLAQDLPFFHVHEDSSNVGF